MERFPFVPSDESRLERDCYEAYNIQVAGLVQPLRAIRSQRVVIGISRGLNSTHALIVAAKAMDLLGLPRTNILDDLPPKPGVHATFARDYEYKRHDTLSLLAGIDLLTGKVHALVRDRHRSREFIEFLKRLDAAYPAGTTIKLILDNHSAHISRETTAWLDARPPGRFEFTFTPRHGSWLNLIEGFFSKFARSVLRHIRVASKHELKERIMAGIDDVNRHPVIHTWSYKLADAA